MRIGPPARRRAAPIALVRGCGRTDAVTCLRITIHRHGDTLNLHLFGEIDMATSTVLDRAIAATVSACAPTDGVLVDLTAVTFLDCMGVTTLLTGLSAATAHGIGFHTTNANGSPLRVLRIFGLDTIFR